MTDTHCDSNTSTQCPSSLPLDTLDQSNDHIRTSSSSSQSTQHQQYDTPRAKRFSQKLVEAAKKQPLARTPSTSASLSPPLESCMIDDDDDDDESMTDIDSTCFASPNRDDQTMNNHFQNLLLSSPLRPDLTMMRPLQLDDSHPSSSIPEDQSEPNDLLNRRRLLQDKRPNKQRHHQTPSDSPSLSAKPKRRKLKQQRTTAWRMGADATLDIDKIHLPVEPSTTTTTTTTTTTISERRPSTSSSPTPTSSVSPHQENTRRSSRLANRKVSYGENIGSANSNNNNSNNNKKPLVVLGIPGGAKAEKNEPSATSIYENEDNKARRLSNNEQQQRPARKIRRRVDTVEQRLNQLIFARDTLDLSQHSVLPTSDDKTVASSTKTQPSVVVIDDSGDESDSYLNDTQTQFTKTTMESVIDDNGDENDGQTQDTKTTTESGNTDVQQQHNENSMDNSNSHGDEIVNDMDLGRDDDNKMILEPVNKCIDISSSPLPTTLQPRQHSPVSMATDIDEDTDMAEVNETGALNGELPPPTQTPSTDIVHTQDEHDDDLDMADEEQTPPIQDSTHQAIPASTPTSPSLETKDEHITTTTTNMLPGRESNILDMTSTTIRAPSLTPSPSSTTSPPEFNNDPILAPSDATLETRSATNQDTTPTSTNDDHHIQPSASSTLPSPNVEETVSTPMATNTPDSDLPSQHEKDMYTLLTNDKHTVATTTTLTEDQNMAATSTSSATEMNNNVGSSDGGTLFGRLIGSASHFFLGN